MHEGRGRGEWEREKKITHSTLSSTSLRPNRISASARSLACSSYPYRSLESNLGTDRSRRHERQGVSFVGRPKSCFSFSPKSSQGNAAKKETPGRTMALKIMEDGRTDRRGTEFYSSKRDGGETKVAPADRFLARWFPVPSLILWR